MTLILNCCYALFILVFWTRNCLSKNSFLKGPPALLNEKDSQKKTVNEGKDIKLTCPVDGNPEPIIEWSKGAETIPADGWERFRAVKTSLKIKEVSPEDQGKYFCKAVNGFGSAQFIFYLTVLASLGNVLTSPAGDELRLDQVFPVSGSTLRKITGQSVRFKCIATGDPTPEITWLKNGHVLELLTEIEEEESFSDDLKQVPSNSFQLMQLTPDDSGNYTCLATNAHGAVMANWTLNVVGNMPSDGADIFPLEMPNVTTFSGEVATLNCKGAWDSSIHPKVMWLREINEKSIHNLPQNQTFTYKGKHYQVLQPTKLILLENGLFLSKLVIEVAQIEDSGLYVCTVSNRFGVNVRQANLTVLESGVEDAPILLVSGLALGVVLIVVIAVSISIYRKRSKPSIHSGPTERALIPPAMGPGHAKLQPAPSSRQPRYVIHHPPNVTAHSLQPCTERAGMLSYSANVVHLASDVPLETETSVENKEQQQHHYQHQQQHQQEQQPIIIYQDPNLAGSVYLASHQAGKTPQPTKFQYRQFDVI